MVTPQEEIYRSCELMRRGDERQFTVAQQIDFKELLTIVIELAQELGVCVCFCWSGREVRVHCFSPPVF